MPNNIKTILPIAVTAGEPAGIGPDLIIQYCQVEHDFGWIVFADKAMLEARAKLLALPIEIKDYQEGQNYTSQKAQQLFVKHIPLSEKTTPAILNVKNANYVLETIKQSTLACLKNEFSAVVTAPIHKGIINEAGIPFTGHTEYLAELTNAKLAVMLLAAEKFRVALLTTHLPLREVSDKVTPELIINIVTIMHNDLQQKFGLKHPHILVCGLNPHAGEDGHLGIEELDIIIPTLDALRKNGFNLTGPLPADTLFTKRNLDGADAVLAMYHDQGLPVLKHAGFGKSVNITLGLPIIRTSVDHGTALDLAGTGKANIGSLNAAFLNAKQMAEAKKTNH